MPVEDQTIVSQCIDVRCWNLTRTMKANIVPSLKKKSSLFQRIKKKELAEIVLNKNVDQCQAIIYLNLVQFVQSTNNILEAIHNEKHFGSDYEK